MFLVLIVTLFTAFLVSAALLKFGVTQMWLRYGIAAIAAYASFFLYLYILLYYIYKIRSDREGVRAQIDETLDRMETAADLASDAPGLASTGSSRSHGVGDAFDLFGEGEFVAVIFGILLICGVLFASFYVVYIAPEILFEIAFDAFMGFGYYRVMKSRESKHWSEGAIKSTIIPFLITLALVVVCGAVIQSLVPGAIKLRDIFQS